MSQRNLLIQREINLMMGMMELSDQRVMNQPLLKTWIPFLLLSQPDGDGMMVNGVIEEFDDEEQEGKVVELVPWKDLKSTEVLQD